MKKRNILLILMSLCLSGCEFIYSTDSEVINSDSEQPSENTSNTEKPSDSTSGETSNTEKPSDSTSGETSNTEKPSDSASSDSSSSEENNSSDSSVDFGKLSLRYSQLGGQTYPFLKINSSGVLYFIGNLSGRLVKLSYQVIPVCWK